MANRCDLPWTGVDWFANRAKLRAVLMEAATSKVVGEIDAANFDRLRERARARTG